MSSVSQMARMTTASGTDKRKPERSGSCSQECSGAGSGPTAPRRTVMPRAGPPVLKQRRDGGTQVRRKQSQGMVSCNRWDGRGQQSREWGSAGVGTAGMRQQRTASHQG